MLLVMSSCIYFYWYRFWPSGFCYILCQSFISSPHL